MLLRETGFTFNGVHSRGDMGLIYAEKDGHVMTPRIRRNAYEIAGVSGTILLDGEARDPIVFRGTLYPANERGTQAEAQTLLRSVGKWLTAGRKQLIFDYEPDKYYLAEISRETEWSLKNWFGGEIGIRFEAQPFAYAVTPASRTVESSDTTVAIELDVATGELAPLQLTVANTGVAPITGVTLGSSVVLSGMSLATGQALTISMEPPIGATIGQASAMQYATAFTPIFLHNGSNTMTVLLTYGSGNSKGARITASARGRW